MDLAFETRTWGTWTLGLGLVDSDLGTQTRGLALVDLDSWTRTSGLGLVDLDLLTWTLGLRLVDSDLWTQTRGSFPRGALKTRKCSGLDLLIVPAWSLKTNEMFQIGLVDCLRVES